jgi:hypothetical protein
MIAVNTKNVIPLARGKQRRRRGLEGALPGDLLIDLHERRDHPPPPLL